MSHCTRRILFLQLAIAVATASQLTKAAAQERVTGQERVRSDAEKVAEADREMLREAQRKLERLKEESRMEGLSERPVNPHELVRWIERRQSNARAYYSAVDSSLLREQRRAEVMIDAVRAARRQLAREERRSDREYAEELRRARDAAAGVQQLTEAQAEERRRERIRQERLEEERRYERMRQERLEEERQEERRRQELLDEARRGEGRREGATNEDQSRQERPC